MNYFRGVAVGNTSKTKEQLIEELDSLLQRLVNLERSETQRRGAQVALRKSQASLAEAQRIAHLGNWDWDIKNNTLHWSDEIYRIFGLEPQQFAATYEVFLNRVHPDDKELVQKSVDAALHKSKSYNIDHRIVLPDGSERVVHEQAEVTFNDNGQPIRMVGTVQDVTERKQMEKELELKAQLLDALTDSILVYDTDGNFVYVNETAYSSRGYSREELMAMNRRELISPEHSNLFDSRINEVMEKGETVFNSVHIRKDGTMFPIEGHSRLLKVGDRSLILSVVRDISERQKMEERLIITDRLASIGELASGIAHELNNPLTGVIGFSQLILEKDVPEDVKLDLKIICSEAQRAAQVVKGLLAFARKHASVKQLVNINSIIEKVQELRAYEQKVSNIQVNSRFTPDLPQVMADYFQLQQVFLNIIINAEYFMIEAHNKGTLTITTERVGDIIRASFRDDGPGISKDDMGHVFDPFFTTKEVGKGTGLGLSICHGVITEHGGRIYAESEPGKGATFIVELPITDHL